MYLLIYQMCVKNSVTAKDTTFMISFSEFAIHKILRKHFAKYT